MIGVLKKRGNFGYGQTCTEEICYEATEKMLPIRNAKDCQKSKIFQYCSCAILWKYQ